MGYGWFPRGIHNPFIKKIISDADNTFVFDGYFYINSEDLPVQRVMVTYDEPVETDDGFCYTVLTAKHIEIYEKVSGNDTSHDNENSDSDGSDSDCSNKICFFPTEITTLKYRILKSNLTAEERDMIEICIKEDNNARNNKKIADLISSTDSY